MPRVTCPESQLARSLAFGDGEPVAYDKLILFPLSNCENAFPGRALTVLEIGALSDLDDVSVWIADVAAYLAVLGDRFRDELRSPAFP